MKISVEVEVLQKLVKTWYRAESGAGGACCQQEELSRERRRTRRECANDINVIINEACRAARKQVEQKAIDDACATEEYLNEEGEET